MTKTFEQLREAAGVIIGNLMPDSYWQLLSKFAHQFSTVYQPDPMSALNRIETELNKFGYSLYLGQDFAIEESAEGDGDDFIIYVAATGDIVKNVYLQVDWEEVSGQQFHLRPDGGKLRYDVEISFEKIDPDEFEGIIGTSLLTGEGEMERVDNPDFKTT